MTHRSLQDALDSARSPVTMLKSSQIGPYAFPVVPAEYSNWRDEQRSWRETCALLNQSHHMTDLYLEGPDALRLLSDLAVNSFERFGVNKGKQFVACNEDGFVIGDAILFHLDTDSFSLVGRPPAINWVQFRLETGDYDARAARDERSAVNRGKRRVYRYQVQGPNATDVIARATGRAVPDVRFFQMDVMRIAGRDVRALRHGMVGAPGFELFGPWEEGEAVRDALVDAGRDFGLRLVGSRTYPTTTLESGWIPSPMPAVYTGDALADYRRWLPATGYEATASLGGSYDSESVEDYYLTPWDLGYGAFVKFDHDFVGRAALERIEKNPRRRKVTLAWNGEDVTRAFGSMFAPGDRAKYIDLPLANYATLPYDKVIADGRVVGLSTYTGYSANEHSMLSLGVVDTELAEPGTEVTLIWGEPPDAPSRPTVEPHVQIEIRATVGPVPYAEPARTAYRPR